MVRGQNRMVWVGGGLALLALLVFSVAFYLNVSYRRSALEAVQVRLRDTLVHEAERLEWMLMEQSKVLLHARGRWDAEVPLFRLGVRPESTSEAGMEAASRIERLFAHDLEPELMSRLLGTIVESLPDTPQVQAVPLFLEKEILGERAVGDALALMWNGLEARRGGDAAAALDWFDKAARVEVSDSEARYVELCTHLHAIESMEQPGFSHLYYMLYLLDEAHHFAADEAQRSFFMERLSRVFPDFERHRTQSAALWQEARRIEECARFIDPDALAFWCADGRVLLRNADGVSALATLDLSGFLGKGIHLSVQFPQDDLGVADRYRLDFFSEVWLWASESALGEHRHAVERHFRLINSALGVLAMLSGALIVGSLLVFSGEQKLVRMRTGFVATVSHELRTPLSLIQLHAETLYHDRADPEQQKGYLRTVIAETERMTGLVNNVVDYSRLGSRACAPRLQRCNLSALCERAIQSFQYRFDTEGIDFTPSITPDLFGRVDPQIFAQVIFNLMDNAIKYSGQAGVVVLALAPGEGGVELRVTDHGIGIPDREKSKIFEAFYRASDRRVSEQRGSGIGLSVTKELLEKCGASIQVADAAPQGTTFTVILPTTEDDEA